MLTKNDYSILIVLFNENCNTEIKSFTIERIKEEVNLSCNKIRNSLKKFIELEMISEGAKQHRSKTYYISKKGIEKVRSII